MRPLHFIVIFASAMSPATVIREDENGKPILRVFSAPVDPVEVPVEADNRHEARRVAAEKAGRPQSEIYFVKLARA